MINSIFYAKDDPKNPKSHNTGKEVRVREKQQGDLMIIQGPLGLRFKKTGKRFKLAIEWGDISNSNPPTKQRVDFWVKSGVHIKGCPNLVIIKVHTHGAWEGCQEAVLGRPAEEMFSYLEKEYNDGKKYRLHYVTARELYNIIKAAEKGKKGNLGEYRDYIIPAAILRN